MPWRPKITCNSTFCLTACSDRLEKRHAFNNAYNVSYNNAYELKALRPGQNGAILETTFSFDISWKKIIVLRFKFHSIEVPSVISQRHFRLWLGAVRQQAIHLKQSWLITNKTARGKLWNFNKNINYTEQHTLPSYAPKCWWGIKLFIQLIGNRSEVVHVGYSVHGTCFTAWCTCERFWRLVRHAEPPLQHANDAPWQTSRPCGL